MSETYHAELIKERLQLQRQLREHFAREGFDYAEYVNPPAGSWMERYHRRIREIDAIIAPELTYSHG